MISHGGKPENVNVKAREIMALTLRLRASDQKPSFVFVVFQSGLKKA